MRWILKKNPDKSLHDQKTETDAPVPDTAVDTSSETISTQEHDTMGANESVDNRNPVVEEETPGETSAISGQEDGHTGTELILPDESGHVDENGSALVHDGEPDSGLTVTRDTNGAVVVPVLPETGEQPHATETVTDAQTINQSRASERIPLAEMLDLRVFDTGEDLSKFSRYIQPLLILPDTFQREVSSKTGMSFLLEVFAVGQKDCVVNQVAVSSRKWKKKSDPPVICNTGMPCTIKSGKRVSLVFECRPESGLLSQQDIEISFKYNGSLSDSVEGRLVWNVSERLFSWELSPSTIFLPEEQSFQHELMLRENEIEATPVLYESRNGGLVVSDSAAIIPRKVLENTETGRSLVRYAISERIEAMGWSRVLVTDCEDEQGQYRSLSVNSADPSGVATEAWIMPGLDGPRLMAPVCNPGRRTVATGDLNLYAVADSSVTLTLRCDGRFMKLHTDSCSIAPGKVARIRFSVLESAMKRDTAKDLAIRVSDGINETSIPVPLQRGASTIRMLEGVRILAPSHIAIGEKVKILVMVPTTGSGELDIEIGYDLFRHRWPSPVVGKGGGGIEWHTLECEMDTGLMHPVDVVRCIVTAVSKTGNFFEQTVQLDAELVELDFAIVEPRGYGRSHFLRFVEHPDSPGLLSSGEFVMALDREDNLPHGDLVWELLDGVADTPSGSIEEIREQTGVSISRARDDRNTWSLKIQKSLTGNTVRTAIIRAVSKPTGKGPELVASFTLLVPDTIQAKDQA